MRKVYECGVQGFQAKMLGSELIWRDFEIDWLKFLANAIVRWFQKIF